LAGYRVERESRSGGDVTLRPNVHFNSFVGTRISTRRAIIISKMLFDTLCELRSKQSGLAEMTGAKSAAAIH
jgi:hypothetical protein